MNVACERLQIENVKRLVELGAPLETESWNGDFPLLTVIDYAHHNPPVALQIASYLIENGANIESRGYMDKTPFLKACTRGDLAIIELLVKHGCDTGAIAEDMHESLNGLDFARIFEAESEVVEYLQKVIA